MNEYFAQYTSEEETTIVFLTSGGQMDKYLELGCSIYEVDEEGEQTLIATPEDGFLVDRPVFPVKETVRIIRE